MPQLPNIICSRCGELKLPKQRCRNCLEKGLQYHGHEVMLESTRKIVAARAKQKKAEQTAKFLKWQKTKIGRHKHVKRNAASKKRLKATTIAILKRVLADLLVCFEKDRAGEYQLYEDRMPEIRKLLPLIHAFLEKQAKLKQPYIPRKSRAKADSFFD